MAKAKTSFFCQNCGAQFAKWTGKCTSCQQWNTIVEEVIQKEEIGPNSVNSVRNCVGRPGCNLDQIIASENDIIYIDFLDGSIFCVFL